MSSSLTRVARADGGWFAARTRHLISAVTLLACALVSGDVRAHDGRRFYVEVVADKLQLQGVNTGESDGAPNLRPYVNSLHDHWSNVSGSNLAIANLPGFEVPHSDLRLIGQQLELDLISIFKWEAPPLMPAPETVPEFSPLAAGEVITIFGPFGDADSTSLGSMVLSHSVPPGGISDLDLFYQINTHPSDEIHVLKARLNATPAEPGVPQLIGSDPIYILLAPAGDSPAERLHHAALFLEEYVTTIPEPTGMAIALVGVCGIAGVGRLFHRRNLQANRQEMATVGTCKVTESTERP